MKMEYVLLFHSKKGYLLTRTPEVVDNELIISFSGAPNNATAIFENGAGNSIYRLLKDDTCAVPVDFLVDDFVKVTITVLDGVNIGPKYICESILIRKINNVLFVFPEGLDIQKELIDVRAENETIKESQKKLTIELQKLGEKVEKLIEGYDFD